MENLNNILQLMGLNPDQLGPEKMKMLEIISKKLIEDPNINPETILKQLGLVQRKEQEKTKQKRNALCSCGSKKKSKKCCNQ